MGKTVYLQHLVCKTIDQLLPNCVVTIATTMTSKTKKMTSETKAVILLTIVVITDAQFLPSSNITKN